VLLGTSNVFSLDEWSGDVRVKSRLDSDALCHRSACSLTLDVMVTYGAEFDIIKVHVSLHS